MPSIWKPRVLRDHPQLAAVGRLTLLESFRCVRMALSDESRRRLISFREMHTAAPAMLKAEGDCAPVHVINTIRV